MTADAADRLARYGIWDRSEPTAAQQMTAYLSGGMDGLLAILPPLPPADPWVPYCAKTGLEMTRRCQACKCWERV